MYGAVVFEWEGERPQGNLRAIELRRRDALPVLDIALDELPARGPEEMLAGYRWAGCGERHAVLQLVPKTIGAWLGRNPIAPRLAGERLVALGFDRNQCDCGPS
jgi:hypothetical protein